MGNCCRPASSMEWDGEDWSSLKSNSTRRKTSTRSSKVFDEAHHDGLCLGKVQKEKVLGVLRVSPDANGQVKLRISKKELAELLEVIENENNNQQQILKKNQVGGGRACSAEQVLNRLINARDLAIANKHHGPWKPMLECIPESPKDI